MRGPARAYNRGSHTVAAVPTQGGDERPLTVLDENGDQWRVSEEALVGVDGPVERLERIPSYQAYWFGWFAFFPLTQVYGEQGGAAG